MPITPRRSVKLFKILIELLFIFLFVSISSHATTNIWYAPHPDDEILGMGGAIRNSVLDGNNNIVVLLTQGKRSNVRKKIKVSKEVFGNARVLESVKALELLGINREDIYVYDYPDGKLTIEDARNVISTFIQNYPDAIHNTVSVFDTHPDHQRLAKALYYEYIRYNKSFEINFYRVYIFRQPQHERLSNSVELVEIRDTEAKINALEAFSHWEPDEDLYSIGRSSVPDLIYAAQLSPFEYKDDLSSIGRLLLKTNNTITPQIIALPFLFYSILKFAKLL